MIRCVRIWTGDDQNSHVEVGWIDLNPGAHGDLLSDKLLATSASFQETAAGGALAWNNAPDATVPFKPDTPRRGDSGADQ